MDDENKLRVIYDTGARAVLVCSCALALLLRWTGGDGSCACLHAPPRLSVLVPTLTPLPTARPPPAGNNDALLTWTNTGSLGGGGETRVTARMKLDKLDQQVGGCVCVLCARGEKGALGGRWGVAGCMQGSATISLPTPFGTHLKPLPPLPHATPFPSPPADAHPHDLQELGL